MENGDRVNKAKAVLSVDTIRKMIDSVVSGSETTESVINGIGMGSCDDFEKTPDSIVCECTNAECKYSSDSITPHCPQCGCKTTSFVVKSKPLSNKEDYVNSIIPETVMPIKITRSNGDYSLGDLRPSDKFVFVDRVPEGVDVKSEYTVVPCDRGFIAFSDNVTGIHKLPISHALCMNIKLTSDIRPLPKYERKSHVGDKIVYVKDNRRGVVVEDGLVECKVKFDIDGVVTFESIPQRYLIVFDKDKTTADYVKYADSTYFICVGDFISDKHATLKDALAYLYEYNRLAFNRYSKYLFSINENVSVKGNPFIVDDVCLKFLKNIDPKVWSVKFQGRE
jgi:hypothetical protein